MLPLEDQISPIHEPVQANPVYVRRALALMADHDPQEVIEALCDVQFAFGLDVTLTLVNPHTGETIRASE